MLFVDHAQILLRAGKKGNLYLFFYDYNYFLWISSQNGGIGQQSFLEIREHRYTFHLQYKKDGSKGKKFGFFS